ncbi:MAG: hypothetical protein FJX74_20700, partial [Armatimonadetes bacterium]|nr:hypothetical protein [Armatimonadota bacterium]
GEEGTPLCAFSLGGEAIAKRLAGWIREHARSASAAGVATETTRYIDPATRLAVEVEARVHDDFPAVEWMVRLRNEGPEDTPAIGDLQALSATLDFAPHAPCTVRYSRGGMCTIDDFALVERSLQPGGRLRLQPGGGRSSSEVLPFFNVILGGEGAILAVGWTGEWAAEFARGTDGTLSVRAGMDRTHLILHPGESIRTPRLLLLFWQGEPIRGHNLLRRFLLKHHRPRPSGEPLIAPLTNGNWGGTPASVHLDNLRRIAEHDLPFEYYWIDAEWFGGPGHWMQHAGDWTVRADLYPDGFEPIRDMLRSTGRKLLLWFEPERVAPDTPWARDHAEWLLEAPPERAITWADYGFHMAPDEWARWECRRNQLNPGDRLLNLGNPNALRFLTDFLSERIESCGIGCFRQDSNIAQLEYWRHADLPDRQGMTEIRYIEGQYALWDELLARHPGLIIDNCASGGRRIDLESIGRATPLWRTDHINLGPSRIAFQCHTWGLLHWVPLNGTTAGYLDRVSAYEFRSSLSSALQAGLWGHGDIQQERIPDDYPFGRARTLLEEYLSLRDCFYGDYYPLTEYTQAEDAWMAYQLDRPEHADGLVVVLKRPRSPFTRARLRLHGLRGDAEYRLTDLDTGGKRTKSGSDLMEEGLKLELAEAPASALIRYTTA